MIYLYKSIFAQTIHIHIYECILCNPVAYSVNGEWRGIDEYEPRTTY